MRPSRHFDRIFALALVLSSGIPTECFGQDTRGPMEQLRSEFERAAAARGNDLLGTWVLVRHVMTEAFITGRAGPDHLLSDSDGVRRDMSGRRRLEWRLTIERGTDHKLRAISETVWEPSGDSSVLEFTERGDFVFEKQYGGEGRWIYRCRRKDSRELICLLKDHETGHGVVFRKTEPPPNKALEPAAFNILLRTDTLSRGGSAPRR